ncbi:MAG: glycosyltransferase [Chitinophagaceae bacterium]
MKIALIGNVCNNMYNIGMALKKHTDIVPHLYLDNSINIHSDPSKNDPNASSQSDWVFYSPKWDPTLLFKRLDYSFVRKLRKEKYDAIIVSDVGVWLAPFVKDAKFLFWTTGADLTRMPFPATFNFFHKGIKAKIKAWYMAFAQRWGIRNVDYFMTQPFELYQYALRKLHVPSGKISNTYFPIIIDLGIFKFNNNFLEKISTENHEKIKKFKFKIFLPSRLMIEKNDVLVNAGQWKGNEMILKGLRCFIDKYNMKDICIMLPDRVYSKDADLFKKIAQELQVQDNVVWIKGQTSEGFNKEEMVALYSCSDLVADEFGVGAFGSIVVEAAACSRPIMCYVDETIMKQLYPWHPIISVNTPDKIADEIAKLYFDNEHPKRVALESRRWAEEFHSQENAGKKYAEQIERLLLEK